VIVVVGYASVDRTLRLDRLPSPGVTARVLSDVGDVGGPHPGGIGHTVLALAATVDDVVPVCAVGDDAAGRDFTDALAAAGCRVDGIVASAGRSPTADLLYDPDGHAACVFDPGVDWASLTPRQRELVAAADVLVAMVGPASVIRATLADSRPGATVAWIVKNDPAALLADVVTALRRRADIIFHNAAESSVVDGMPAESKTVVVRTDGPRPVIVTTSGEARSYPIAPCATVRNPTGAGDAFAGGYLAMWLDSADEARCVAAGAAAARRRFGVTP
jgi:sugar/nucleoside kinase (ribokinase family)